MAKHIGVAISGGGHRATVWGIGSLLYLVDSGKNAEVGAISSVSGGSITNGVVAHEVDYPYVDSAAFDAAMRPLTKHVADTGLFFWGPSTNAYVISMFAALAVGVLTLITGLVFIAIDGLRVVSGLVTLGGILIVALAARYFERRSLVVDKAIAKTHFTRDGKATLLSETIRSVDHIYCATELQSADHLYFSSRFLYSFRFGLGQPQDLQLSTAVQCSACLPGAFAARRIKATPYFAADPDGVRKEIALVDGGVYDNMADQWIDGLAARVKRAPELPLAASALDESIIVNSSAATGWTKVARSKMVVLSELGTLARVQSVMYQVTTERRRQALVAQWEHSAADGAGMRGALVHIAQSPYTVADHFVHSSRPDVAARARAVIDLLGDEDACRAEWRARSDASRHVPTVLRKLGRETTLGLLEHAYVLSMCNLHVLLGYPLSALPSRSRFERLLTDAPPIPTQRVLDLRDGEPSKPKTTTGN